MDANRREVAATLRAWINADRPSVLATVVSSSGSAPRGLGAQLAIAGPEEWVGALSGGCTEAAVIGEAEQLLLSSTADGAAYVAYSKETLADIGPVCGSTLGVVVERVDEALVELLEASVSRARAGEDVELHRSWTWDGAAPSLAEDVEPGLIWQMRRAPSELAMSAAGRGERSAVATELTGERLTSIHHIEASTHLVLGGGGDVARELVALAQRLAWRTSLLDPRRTIAEQTARAAGVDQLITGWPDASWDELNVGPRSACVALAHESHLDEPFLERALASDAFYVGAVGSRRVQAARRVALKPLVGGAAIGRLRGPAGLDLGGHAAAEIALAIVAEIIAMSNDRVGASLAATDGPIRAR